MIRKATTKDLDGIVAIYDAIHDLIEAGKLGTGWIRSIYPTRDTAEGALARDDLYVLEEDGEVKASAIINQRQEEVYPLGNWQVPAKNEEVLVIHTMVVDPGEMSKGYARQLLRFYEDMARDMGCVSLRFDTGVTNDRARALYASIGCREVGIVPIESFHGSPPGEMVLLEKEL